MTYAEQLLAEGEAKGGKRAKVQIVEGLLRAGVAWDVIEVAAGPGARGAGGGLAFAGGSPASRPF